MALPYDITKRIRQNFASSDDANDGKDSFYIQIGGKKCEIRISNHCTHLWTWHERHNGKFDDITRLSIVFEDKDTYTANNLLLKKPRKTPLRVYEFVYRINDPNEFTAEDVKLVIQAIKSTIKKGVMYCDTTNKMLYYKERISKNPKPNNKMINCNRQMNKKLIRLTESDLHRIVKESVNKVLREGLWNAIERDGYQIYDTFVDFIKNYYAPNDDNKAYEIENNVNDWMVQMMEDLDSKYGSF